MSARSTAAVAVGEPLLVARGIAKRFGGVQALSDVSFEIRMGEIYGLIGPNGAGKTTLFNCLSRLYECGSGDILFNGTSLLQVPKHGIAALGIGRTFQLLQVFPQLTVRENLILAGQEHQGSMWSRLVGRRDAPRRRHAVDRAPHQE